MNKDGLFIFFTILVLIVFVAIAYYWLKTGSKEYNIDDTIKGLYKNAGLNQKCSTTSSENVDGVTILLPQYYEPQTCGYNLECVLGSTGDIYGYCKSKVGGQCFSVYDCAPDTNNDIYCTGGICTIGPTGVLGSASGSPGTIGGGTICNAALGLTGFNGVCLLEDGYNCNYDYQCAGGKCTGVTGFAPFTGVSGVCISRLAPTSYCNIDYCQDGFGCYIANNEGYCQPLDKTGPIPTGARGAFCDIPLYPGTVNNLPCDEGLICNFDASIMAPSGYPNVVGYGLCDIPIYPAASTCSSSSGACIPPNVCYAGECLAPKENATGDSDINWCGYGSTTKCGVGYECDDTIQYCLPNTVGSLCSGPYVGTCVNGLSCDDNKLGIFTPLKTGNTGAGDLSNFGLWSYMSLPSGETTLPSNESYITTYQYMTIESSLPVTYTVIAYLPRSFTPNTETAYFWFIRIKISESNNDITIIDDWVKVDFINTTTPYALTLIDGIKFTSSGNISLRLNDLPSPSDRSLIYYYTFDPVNFNSNTFDTSIFLNAFSTGLNLLHAIDWDIDDKFNLVGGNPSAAMLTVSGSTTTIYYDSLSVYNKILLNLYPQVNNSSTQTGNFVKYIYNYNNTPNIQNFIFNGTDVGNNLYKIYIPINTLSIQMNESTCSGMASFETYLNNIENMEMYYISDKGFRYFNASFKNLINNYSSIDVGIQGYAPNYTLNTNVQILSYGNLDRRMFSLTKNCQ